MNEKPKGPPGSRQEWWELGISFQVSRVFLTGYELGVFSALGDDTKASADVAREIQTDPRATDRLMNALAALGLLEKQGNQFRNIPSGAEFLVRGKEDYMAGLGHLLSLWDTWSTLTDAVREGTGVFTRTAQGKRPEWREAFIAAMHERAKHNASQVAALLDLKNVWRVLDVGGGSGVYSMAMVRTEPALKAVIFDLPEVAKLAAGYIAEAGLSDRMSTQPGDFYTDELGTGYDLVFISAIIHQNSPEQNLALFQKAARALNPGGQLVIQDFIVDDNRTSPTFGILFALNMLVATPGGDTYTAAEMEAWMRQAGLRQVMVKDTGLGASLVMGRKSG